MLFQGVPASPLSPEEKEIQQGQIDTVFQVLEEWFIAIEGGTAEHRLPDPAYATPEGRPAITESLVAEFIAELDREIDTDAFGYQGQKYKADASSEFHRLAQPQRIALVQQIMGAVMSDEEIKAKAQELRALRISTATAEV